MLRFISPWSPAWMQSMPWVAGTDDAAGHNPLNPDDARYYEGGEWLEDDGSGNLRRGGNNAGDNTNRAAVPSYLIFAERGRTDQSVMAGAGPWGSGGAGKVSVVRLHRFEMETDMFDPAGLSAGDPLCVQDFTIGGVVRRVLSGVGFVAGTDYPQARVVSVINGVLRAQVL